MRVEGVYQVWTSFLTRFDVLFNSINLAGSNTSNFPMMILVSSKMHSTSRKEGIEF